MLLMMMHGRRTARPRLRCHVKAINYARDRGQEVLPGGGGGGEKTAGVIESRRFSCRV